MANVHTMTSMDLPVQQRMRLMHQAEAELARNPNNVDAMLAMAALSGVNDSMDKAVDWLRKAHSARKKDPDVLRRLVSAALEARDLDTARKFGRKLCKLDARNPESHQMLGYACLLASLPKQAIESYKAASRLAPRETRFLVALGQAHGMGGDHEAARACYMKALELEPHNVDALTLLGASRKHTQAEADAHVAALTAALPFVTDDTALPPLHYSAGKVLDDSGQFDKAFEHFEKANILVRPKETASLSRAFDNSREVFSKPFMSTHKDYGVPTKEPIFIIGMPRSGTTLTESLCGAHSKVNAGDEMRFLGSITIALGRDEDGPGPYRQAMTAMSPRGSVELAQDYLRRARMVAGGNEHFTDKMPHNFLNVGLIFLLFPNARVIHVRRHPMDNCFSLFSNSMTTLHNQYKSDLNTLGLYYLQYLKLMDHWRTLFPGRMHEIHYEDVVANLELNARQIIDYLGLDWEDSVLDHNRSQRSVRTLSSWQVRQPVYSTSKGRWRHYEAQLEPLKKVLGPAVERYEAELATIGGQTADGASLA